MFLSSMRLLITGTKKTKRKEVRASLLLSVLALGMVAFLEDTLR